MTPIVPTYRARPVVVEAMQYNAAADYVRFREWLGDRCEPRCNGDYLLVTVQRNLGMCVQFGDWLVRESDGHFSRWSAEEFAARYEVAA